MSVVGTVYGSRGFHLVVMTSGFALATYTVAVAGPASLWNPKSWWQSIAVWFVAAILAHDLVLFPIYTLADRILWGKRDHRRARVSARNHLRIPALGSGLTLLVFLPGILKQGAPTYLAATGQTQDPFLGRWLVLTAAMFAASAVVYAARLIRAHRRSAGHDGPPR